MENEYNAYTVYTSVSTGISSNTVYADTMLVENGSYTFYRNGLLTAAYPVEKTAITNVRYPKKKGVAL